jgi:ATP-dependent HslUV protease ATP-binding subunit HslU
MIISPWKFWRIKMNSNNPTPSEIVGELDKYIISQDQAKKVVAIALRNRFRRRMLPPELQEEVAPKNIIMIGPTGVGKTEIARRLANLAHAPFIKVEATKYTEVGYVGRDVESMVRDLAELAVNMVRDETMKTVQERAEVLVEERILDALVPPVRKRMTKGLNLGSLFGGSFSTEGEEEEEEREKEEELIHTSTREKFRGRLRAGLLDDKMVEIEIEESFRPKFVEVISVRGIIPQEQEEKKGHCGGS